MMVVVTCNVFECRCVHTMVHMWVLGSSFRVKSLLPPLSEGPNSGSQIQVSAQAFLFTMPSCQQHSDFFKDKNIPGTMLETNDTQSPKKTLKLHMISLQHYRKYYACNVVYPITNHISTCLTQTWLKMEGSITLINIIKNKRQHRNIIFPYSQDEHSLDWNCSISRSSAYLACTKPWVQCPILQKPRVYLEYKTLLKIPLHLTKFIL